MLKHKRMAAGLTGIGVLALTLAASSAGAQTTGEGRAAFVVGLNGVGPGDDTFRGVVGGGGVRFNGRLGVDGEFGFVLDDSTESVLAPMWSAGTSVQLARTRRARPFLDVGGTRLGDWAGWYAGGGVNYVLSDRTALHLGLRAFLPTTNFGCRTGPGQICMPGPRVAFLRAGLSFGRFRSR